MSLTLTETIEDGEALVSAPVMSNFNTIVNFLNAGIDTDYIVDDAVTTDKLATGVLNSTNVAPTITRATATATTSSSATAYDITGLSISITTTVTKNIHYCMNIIYSIASTGNGWNFFLIRTSGGVPTTIKTWGASEAQAGYPMSFCINDWDLDLAAGTHVYKVQAQSQGAGTCTVTAASTMWVQTNGD